MDLQFYPTPLSLAERVWEMFKDRDFVRVLEPSAGDGAMMAPRMPRDEYRNRQALPEWDAIEVDATKHARLREQGARVVGHDFLSFRGGEVYSHIVMNPPFAQGAQHLLHAWEVLYAGEIVCILNAETLRNAFSKERQMLLSIIDKHGRVEFVQDAFKGEDVEREACVEVALVHLTKTQDSADLVGDILGDLKADRSRHGDDLDFGHQQQLMLPQGFVEDLVLRFDAAVLAAKQSVQASVRAAHYARLLGMSLAERNKAETAERLKEAPKNTPLFVRQGFAQQYDELKDRAWAGVLRSTEVLTRLSSSAQRRMEKEFETIKTLEFTAANIYGFLLGLCEAANEIQQQMVLDVFDEISRYHEDNTVFYMGWKSNTKHRTAGMRLKTTRFVLPGHGTESWNRGLSFDSVRLLADFDKVFAMLDGKSLDAKAENQVFGLRALFETPAAFESLRNGGRETSDYFEVRYYPKRGTIHFFPRSKELMDRLNRVVGTARKWLPPDLESTSEDFQTQYAQAEKFDREVRAAFVKGSSHLSGYHRSAYWLLGSVVGKRHDDEDAQRVNECMSKALEDVLASKGIYPQEALESGPTTAQLEAPQLSLTFEV